MLKRNHFLSRRDVLGTAAGAVFLAPLLRARRLAAQNLNPKRLVICFTPDSHPPEWWPTGSGTSFSKGIGAVKEVVPARVLIARLKSVIRGGAAGAQDLVAPARLSPHPSIHAVRHCVLRNKPPTCSVLKSRPYPSVLPVPFSGNSKGGSQSANRSSRAAEGC